MHILILATLAAVATAMPSYIAVPADQIAFLDLSALRVRRVPRQTLTPPPPPPQLPQALYEQEYQQEYHPVTLQQYQQQQVALSPQEHEPARLVRLQPQDVSGAASLAPSARLAERPPDFGEYVDFGAHTGDNGAFGWYADFPVNNHEDSSGYRK